MTGPGAQTLRGENCHQQAGWALGAGVQGTSKGRVAQPELHLGSATPDPSPEQVGAPWAKPVESLLPLIRKTPKSIQHEGVYLVAPGSTGLQTFLEGILLAKDMDDLQLQTPGEAMKVPRGLNERGFLAL